ncbi:MAG: amidohydrolase, partial [Pseudomonadales bacterium]
INGHIYANQNATAVAIERGVIRYIGKDEGALAIADEDTEIIDLEGAFVLPGFIDNHNHLFEAGSVAAGQCELSPDENLAGLAAYLADCAAQTSGEGWLMGHGFSLEGVLESDSAQTPRQLLDAYFPTRPVALLEQTSHAVWLNSAALQEMGWHNNTAPPQGGWLLKSERGELNGIVLDSAGDLVIERAWRALPDLAAQNLQGLRDGLAEVARHGITTVGDGRMYWRRGWLQSWLTLERSGELSARVSLRPWIYPNIPMAEQLPVLRKMQRSNPHKLLLINQAKLYSDGIIGNTSAKLLRDYTFSYLPHSPRGLNYIAPTALKTWLAELQRIGYGAHIHAIGDGAVRESLDAVAALPKRHSDTQYSLTHIEMLDNADTKRFFELDVSADFQVGGAYIIAGDHSWARPFIGHRVSKLLPLGKLFRSGANITLSSDWDVNPLSPLAGIANSLRLGTHGLPDIHSAIAAYTINPARSLGLADITGSIALGKSADFTLLDRDITALPAAKISDAQVLMTVLRGEIVYDSETD